MPVGVGSEPSQRDPGADAVHAARSGATQLLSIAGQALTPVYSVLVARLFGLAAFGAYQASLAVLDVLVRVGAVGAIGSQHLFIARHRAAGETDLELRALGTGLRMAGVVSAALALGLGLCAGGVARLYHVPRLSGTLPIMAPAIFFTAVTSLLVAATFGAKVARVSLYVRGIAEPAFLLGACVAAWAIGGGLRALAAAYVVAAALTTTCAIVASSRIFGVTRLLASLRTPRHPTYLRFALPLAVADAMSALLQRTDIFLVTAFVGVEAAGIYAAAEFIVRVIANTRYIFDPIAAPVLSEAFHTGDRVRLRYNLQLMTRWVIAAAAPIAGTVVVLRHPLLDLYGPSFAGGASCLVILAVAQLISAGLGLTSYAVLMGGNSRLMLVTQFGAALLNVVLGLILIPRYGIAGAAIAVLVSLSSLQVALTIAAWLLLGVHPFARSLLKPLLAAAVALSVELLLWAVPVPDSLRAVAVVCGGVVAYGAVLVALGMPEEERRIWAAVKAKLGMGRR